MARKKTKIRVYVQGKDGLIDVPEIGEADTLAAARKIPNESAVYEYHRVIAVEGVDVRTVKKIERTEIVDE